METQYGSSNNYWPIQNSKWISTAASVWIQCSGGASYTFGIYSGVLKSSQAYDQSTLDTVSVFKDIGANAGVMAGLLFSAVAPRRIWAVHAAGAAQCFVGYFFLWAAVTGVVWRPPVAATCFFMFLAAHAQTFFNTANVVVGVRNFSGYGGTIVGILKGFHGISGAILVQIYTTLGKGNPSSFLLMLAFTPTLVSLSLMLLIKIHDDETMTINDKPSLNALSGVAVATAAYVTALIILEDITTLSTLSHVLSLALLLIFLVSSPLAIAVQAHKENDVIKPISTSTTTSSTTPLLLENNSGEDLQDMDILQAMSGINFWLLFITMVCALGTGMATVNNLNQLGQSLGYKPGEITSLVSLWSVWNFLGRFGAGYLSDILLRSRGWPRPVFMAITLGMMSVGHVIVASGFTGNLYVGSMLVGVSYGAQWSLMPTICAEIFGVGHMGTIFNTIAVSSPIGSYIFSVRVIGYIYDNEAKGNACYGEHCFMLSFLVMASVACFGCVVALVLFYRTRQFYRAVVLTRLVKYSSLSETE